jgi:biofilm protein TabA
MIINTLSNLNLYSGAYQHLDEAIKFLAKKDFSSLKEGKNEFSDNFYIVKNIGNKKSDFDGILEVHKDWVDIHIPLTDDEIIVFKSLDECANIVKEYDPVNDYMLYRAEDLAQVVIPVGYCCIIDTTMCHMAMLGEGSIEKLVVKFRK